MRCLTCEPPLRGRRVGFWGAGALTLRSGRAVRPSPDLAIIRPPRV